MTNLLKPSMLAFVLVLHTCNAYSGNPGGAGGIGTPGKPTTPVQASEVDPSLALGGLTLLAGALTVLRARRRK
jgi:LPXTG-motif cell wall-anchored protein